MKTKTEPASARLKRPIEVLNTYSFNLSYMKYKDITLTDFLCRIKVDKSNSHEIINYFI